MTMENIKKIWQCRKSGLTVIKSVQPLVLKKDVKSHLAAKNSLWSFVDGNIFYNNNLSELVYLLHISAVLE